MSFIEHEIITPANFLEETRKLAYEGNFAETPMGKFAFWYSLSIAKLTRPLLRQPSMLLNSSLLDVYAGSDYNPSLEIDKIGGILIHQLLDNTQDSVSLYVEEEGWSKTERFPKGGEYFILLDPFDGTSCLRTGLCVQAVGISIADQEANFLSGAITSLVDNEIAIFEDQKYKLVSYNDETESHSEYPLREISKPVLPIRNASQANIATLARRMLDLRNTPLFKDRYFPDLPTFGGYGLLAMLRGQIDVMMDPSKGQPWYEAYQWGNMAKTGGLLVSDHEGRAINFPEILLKAAKGKDTERIRIIISNNPQLHNQILEGLRTNQQEIMF